MWLPTNLTHSRLASCADDCRKGRGFLCRSLQVCVRVLFLYVAWPLLAHIFSLPYSSSGSPLHGVLTMVSKALLDLAAFSPSSLLLSCTLHSSPTDHPAVPGPLPRHFWSSHICMTFLFFMLVVYISARVEISRG